MNFPDLNFWSHLAARLGLEVFAVVALASLSQRAVRRGVWQRTIWQIAVICLLGLVVSEWSGFGRGLAGVFLGQQRGAKREPATPAAAAKSQVQEQTDALTPDLEFVTPQGAVWLPGWIWLGGAALVLTRVAAAQILMLAMRLRRGRIDSSELQQRVRQVARSLGMKRKILLLRTPGLISPMAFGIVRFSIGLPPQFETRFTATEQDAILAHELAHLAALDPLWFRMADVAGALLWWHPLAWWARRSLHGASELAADEATAVIHDGPGSLAKCLVTLGNEMTGRHGWGWVGINGGFRSNLGKRVERLMEMSCGTSRPVVSWVDVAARKIAAILAVPAIVLLFGAFQSVKAQHEESWRGEIRQSWIESPGARLMLAMLDDTGKIPGKIDIASRIQDARFYYESGDLDRARFLFKEILKEDPSNRDVPYYLDLIKIARYVRWRQETYLIANYSPNGVQDTPTVPHQPALPVPNPIAATNLVPFTKGRVNILSKLESIRFPEVHFDQPLAEVLLSLKTESKNLDPEGRGINFLVNPHADVPTDSIADPPSLDMNTVKIKISPAMSNLRLRDILNAITMVADHPIKYSIEDYAVVFSPKPAEAATLYSKVFHVDPNAFFQQLQLNYGTNASPAQVTLAKVPQTDDGIRRPTDGHDSFGGPAASPTQYQFVTKTNNTLQLDQMSRAYFAAAGVELDDPGKSLFYNDRLGLLLMRGTKRDLQIIQDLVDDLNQ